MRGKTKKKEEVGRKKWRERWVDIGGRVIETLPCICIQTTQKEMGGGENHSPGQG